MTTNPALTSDTGTTVLLFGPHALSFNVESLQTLRDFIHEADNCKWMLVVVSELTLQWKQLAERFPKLREIPGEKLLDELNSWFRGEKIDKANFQLPNILLTPLVVLTQLTQFVRYLSYSRSGTSTQAADLFSSLAGRNIETVGFCTGLLSATTVSSLVDQASFEQYGAVAVRLAMMVGALADAQDISDRLHGLSKSFAVAWASQDMAKEMVRVLDCFPEAYISVLFDHNRATLTTAERTAPLLVQQLKQKGVTIIEVGLRGRFHSQCHHDDLEELLKFCDLDPSLQFPETTSLSLPIHLGSNHEQTSGAKLHHTVLQMILVEQSAWYETFSQVVSTRLEDNDSVVICLGPERGVPPSLLRKIGPRLVHTADLDQAAPSLMASALYPHAGLTHRSIGYGAEDDIAVVGMACQVAGASDLNDFWKILCKGESQHIEVPAERFGPETQWREVDPNRKWYGNFIKDHDVFDHKFFKKSPREIVSTDPQQRLMLQCAYQAVEQSGYFHQPDVEKNIGCYLGACAADYEQNVAGYAPTAFTATGNLKSFIAGKISHYFGWTGPGLTIDTACSASAVAIHQACKAIIGGECSGALAGGVGLMGNITWFQNLAGASFLSPTGQCKPWDEHADGYCRGEAVAFVFIKKMSEAIADGNQILGCISSTAVYQNENCTPVFVPNSPSLTYLFKDVLRRANLEPQSVSVVEAHGTGTPVGDPAEYESVLQALGGPSRDRPLALGSVKGLVGHTEGASGVVSLIKTILMIQKGYIPPQASFNTMAHNINVSPSDMIEIVTKLKPWEADFKAALINNYGASGSNASMIVTQPLHSSLGSVGLTPIHAASVTHPFWLCGLDDRALRDYSIKLRHLISEVNEPQSKMTVANLSFNLCRQSNRQLDKGLMFSCSTIEDLNKKLSAFIEGDSKMAPLSTKAATRPVVMCFGGQISNFVGLDKQVYDSVKILRSYLDQCNAVFLSIGLEGIYPVVFQRQAIECPIKLQITLFAVQYACAKSWMNSGVQVAAVVGHSFGELTALCISGVLSLKDTAKMIAARAKLVRNSWGADKGAMVAVEADLGMLRRVLDEFNEVNDDIDVTIACFNGPRSFTLAGPTGAIDKLTQALSSNPAFSAAIRFKRLNVTNAFHSTLVEPLIEELEDIGRTLTFREPMIPLERSTEQLEMDMPSDFVARHMRDPVYFHQAVQRLSRQYPEAVWLEAGSNSTITTMANRALGSPSGSYFQGLNITSSQGIQNLAESTLALWKNGVKTEYWPHHPGQTYEYDFLFLPPYQFEKMRHWMDLKKPARAVTIVEPPMDPIEEEAPTSLWSFIGYQNNQETAARFRVNTASQKYKDFVSGHLIAQTAPICPATLEVDMAIEALMSIRPDYETAGMQASIRNMENHSPICVDPSRTVYIDYEAHDLETRSWKWKIVSRGSNSNAVTDHVHGQVIFYSPEDPNYQAEFERYRRFYNHQRCLSILNSHDADDIIQGRNLYKTFAEIVDYGEQYRGLRTLIGIGNECAGRVHKAYSGDTWFDTHLSDCFSQVGGIWVNCMTNRAPEDMYIASGCELVIRSPDLRRHSSRPEVWDVLACHHQSSEKMFITDVFVFDSTNGQLVEVMLGINYARVAKASMQKILRRLSPGMSTSTASDVKTTAPKAPRETPPAVAHSLAPASGPMKVKTQKKPKSSTQPDFKSIARNLLANVSGVEPEDIMDDTELADIGIDSLMGMELAREVEQALKCTMPADRLMEVFDFPSFVDCIKSVLAPTSSDDETESETEDDDSASPVETSSDTPGTSPAPSLIEDRLETSKMDVVGYLTDLLGVGEDDIQADTLLIDLGVDSLLSTELRSDLSSKFNVEVSEDISIEAMSVAELDIKVNGAPIYRATVKPKVAEKVVSAVLVAPANIGKPASPHLPSVRVVPGDEKQLVLPPGMVLETFGRAKLRTDHLIREYKLDNFAHIIYPKTTQLCIALTLEAFEKLGVSISTAKPGQVVPRIKHASQHRKLVEYLYTLLENEARLIDTRGSEHVRTAISPPKKSSNAIFQDLVRMYPDWSCAMKLTQFAGLRLADVLTAKTDGIKVIFGSEEGRTLVSGLYCDHVFNKMSYQQMADCVEDLISRLPVGQGPLKIMEMGAGTGGTTLYMAPLLEGLGANVEYTFTDLSPSMVAAAKKKFKKYPFMRFLAHDIEKPVPADLLGTQHIVLASNAIHATHDLVKSSVNIRNALRPDGFLMMLEMTEIVPFVDIIFGLLEGWWLFDDGRKHAITPPTQWETALHSAGFGHVDWSDGFHPENKIQKVIIAMASGPAQDRLPLPEPPAAMTEESYPDLNSRERSISSYVEKFSGSFRGPVAAVNGTSNAPQVDSKQCVLITGATGSLGTHLVKEFAERADVESVICINRRSGTSTPAARQIEAMASRGVSIDNEAREKLQVIETDSNKPNLGLSEADFTALSRKVTSILHNAWPMSGNRPIKGFEAQFNTLRNLTDLARDAAEFRAAHNQKINFQFISSIGVVGHYPLWSGVTRVPEERMEIKSVLPNGYCDAKFTCERILDETLHRYPKSFRTMTARLGQIAGSKTSGYWNPMEHFSFMVKSAKNLNAFPRLDGHLSWCPVNDMAKALAELLLMPATPQPIYHIDNPVQQPWLEMAQTLTRALRIPESNIVPFDDWITRVRRSPMAPETDNPAARLVDFLDYHFRRMSCGGLVLDTTKACSDSPSLAAVGPVSDEVVRKYVSAWEAMGFLY
ncbi:putative polyketide synthase [Nemania diffusa]|nr:putative polyketide synthase [Nemania diffusa]